MVTFRNSGEFLIASHFSIVSMLVPVLLSVMLKPLTLLLVTSQEEEVQTITIQKIHTVVLPVNTKS